MEIKEITKYYYKDHHLYQCYCYFDDQVFNTREDYLAYCKANNIKLHETKVKRKSKYALEWELQPPAKYIDTTLAKKTKVFDVRDISHFYFKDQEDALDFLDHFGDGNSSFALEAQFSGYEDEPDYSPEALSEILLKDIVVEPFNSEKEFKNIAHYIISYLPDDDELKKARKLAHLRQLKSIKAISPHAKIYIIAQNYKDEDYLDDPQITYYKYAKLGAMKARNTALKHFYASNYDFCILNDDDTVAAPTASAINFINELELNPDKFSDFDIIYSRDMYHHPYQPEEAQELDIYNNYYKFELSLINVWHYAIVRNFKKYYNTVEYQDESIDPTQGFGYDDADFCYYLATKHYKIWKCFNAIQSYALNWQKLTHSLVYKEITNPWIRLNNRENSTKKWCMDANGNVSTRWFIDKYQVNNALKQIMLPRAIPVKTELDFTQRGASDFIELAIAKKELQKEIL